MPLLQISQLASEPSLFCAAGFFETLSRTIDRPACTYCARGWYPSAARDAAHKPVFRTGGFRLLSRGIESALHCAGNFPEKFYVGTQA